MRGHLALIDPLHSELDIHIRADKILESRLNVADIFQIGPTRLRHLHNDAQMGSADLNPKSKCRSRDEPKAGLNDLSNRIVLPHRRHLQITRHRIHHDPQVGLYGTTLGDDDPLMKNTFVG